MTLDVYCGRKTTAQQQQIIKNKHGRFYIIFIVIYAILSMKIDSSLVSDTHMLRIPAESLETLKTTRFIHLTIQNGVNSQLFNVLLTLVVRDVNKPKNLDLRLI